MTGRLRRWFRRTWETWTCLDPRQRALDASIAPGADIWLDWQETQRLWNTSAANTTTMVGDVKITYRSSP